ncbi:MAG TPA: efflux transporter outer membrane subunit, partial [Burkholderiaceae bacterium]
SGEAGAQASADDLAGARLSIQTALAQAYLQLRITDQLRTLYAGTTEAYARALKLTRAQHAAGVALLSDVALAESQLTSAQAAAVDLDATRAQLEHAIAILTGRAPAQFTLAPVAAGQSVALELPATPLGLPSTLLERRPDIAAAERRAALANANIGVARAAYYPNLLLSAGGGFSAAAVSSLFDTPSRVWSLGASLAQTLFDGGLRQAHDAQAVAAYDASVAQYKLTVLSGFQQVEDNLSTLRVLDREADYQAQAVQAAQTAERLALSQYRAGTATYLAVVTAQTLSLTNQRTAVQLRGRQLAASVGLITATGGGWRVADATAPAAPAAPAAASAAGPAT